MPSAKIRDGHCLTGTRSYCTGILTELLRPVLTVLILLTELALAVLKILTELSSFLLYLFLAEPVLTVLIF